MRLGLRVTQAAVNGFADVFAFPGFRIEANVDEEQPGAGSAADDLASLACHIVSKTGKRHT